MERLTRQVDAYVGWKRELMREITRYRSWLAEHRLGSGDVDARLERALKTLRSDQITLAFVGEFSRGKSELINALFFADSGQRLLPSSAGRTTMCPTELFHDPRGEGPQIRLLPIETRVSDASVAQFKRSPKHWTSIPLDLQDGESMARGFAQLAKSKPVSREQALALGFAPEMLEPAGQSADVLVPAWRHALINFDHPLLRQGLRILDTPGLNALGSEPELTLSMLPNAQAVLFLLGADTGVTASDLAIWEDHVRQLDASTQSSLFAVLNKIDLFWDGPDDGATDEQALLRVREATARQLGLELDAVLPLSARQALLGKLRGDQVLLERSRLADLEQLLCERMVAQKERLLGERVVSQVLQLLDASQQLLQHRLQDVREQQAQLGSRQQDSGQLLFELTSKTKDDHARHHKRLLGLKSNQRLLQRQGEQLAASMRAERLDDYLQQVGQGLRGSWTTLGINQAIVQFFDSVENDLDHLQNEVDATNLMVAAIYRRHNEDSPQQMVDAPQFGIQRYRNELAGLRRKGDRFRLQLKTLLSEQRSVGRRFFSTLVQEVISLHQRLREEAGHWSGDALMPLMQHTLEHKQMLESHMLRLKSLTAEGLQARQLAQQLAEQGSELQSRLAELSEMLRTLRRPAPLQRQGKVVSLSVTRTH